MDTRARAAKRLYDAGIGFYPLRGNHEGTQSAALLFQQLYPQTQCRGEHVFRRIQFHKPISDPQRFELLIRLRGDARFILLEQFTRTDNSNNHRTAQDTVNDMRWAPG